MALDIDFTLRMGQNARRVEFTNNSAAALSEGDGFYITSGTVTVLADNNTVGLFGVCCADVAVDAIGFCYVSGTFLVDVEGTVNFALGQAVCSAGASSVDAGTTNDIPIGHVVSIDPANGASTVLIEICSQITDRTAV